MKTLETERLILRDPLMSDDKDFFEYASVDGVGECAGWVHHHSIEETRAILKRFLETKDQFAVVLKTNNKMIGTIGLMKKKVLGNGINELELGYVLSKDYWYQGLMTEACKSAIKYAFDELKCDILYVTHSEYNFRSKRVVEKCGFKFCKTFQYEKESMLGTGLLYSMYKIDQ